jgi:hypothetical protein
MGGYYTFYYNSSLMLRLFRRKMVLGKSFVMKMFFTESIFWCLARTENHKYFLYFHLIILTYKNQFLYRTYKII